MRRKKPAICILIFTLLFIFLAFPAFSEDGEKRDYAEKIFDAIPEGVTDAKTSEQLCASLGIKSILYEIFSAVSGNASKIGQFFFSLLLMSVLISVSESGSLEPCRAPMGVTLASSVYIFYSLFQVILSLRESLSLASGFFLRAVPVLSAVLAAGGNVNSAQSQALNMNMALTGVNFICDRVLLPLSIAFFFLAIFDSFSLGSLSSLSRGAHGVFNWILGILCAIIVGGVSLQSILSTASDGVYIRAARQASGTLIPLVGQTVSSAMSLLFGGLAYAKDIVGVSCVAVIVLICISPIVTLLLYRLSFSVCIIILDFTGSSLGTRCLTGFRRALDSALAIYSMSIMVYIFEVLVFMKSGVFSFG